MNLKSNDIKKKTMNYLFNERVLIGLFLKLLHDFSFLLDLTFVVTAGTFAGTSIYFLASFLGFSFIISLVVGSSEVTFAFVNDLK